MKKQLFFNIVLYVVLSCMATLEAFSIKNALGLSKDSASKASEGDKHGLSAAQRRERRITFWKDVKKCFADKGEDSWEVQRATKYLHRAENDKHGKSHKAHKVYKRKKTEKKVEHKPKKEKKTKPKKEKAEKKTTKSKKKGRKKKEAKK